MSWVALNDKIPIQDGGRPPYLKMLMMLHFRLHLAQNNGMMINTNKTKELTVCFNKKVNAEDIPPLCINGSNIDRVTTFKLLGVFVSSDYI